MREGKKKLEVGGGGRERIDGRWVGKVGKGEMGGGWGREGKESER